MSKSNILKKDSQMVWRLAAFRCSYYGCNTTLVKEEKEGILGEMAHIVADSEDGPRGRSELPMELRNLYSNLILLCPTHHTEIDNNEREWTVEKLHQMKQEHEEWINERLQKGIPWRVHICPGLIHYINLRRLLLDPSAYKGLSPWDSTFNFEGITYLSELDLPKLAQIRMLIERYLSTWAPPVLSLSDIHNENVGARIKFETEFLTKNVPGPDKLKSFRFKGNIEQDPHVYCRRGDRKIYVSIDPKYIVTDTAFSIFKSGCVQLSGLGILSSCNETEARITPIVIGAPEYQGSEFMTGRKFGDFGAYNSLID